MQVRVRMPLERLPREVLVACPTGRKPQGDFIDSMALERFRIPQEQVTNVALEREIWRPGKTVFVDIIQQLNGANVT